MSAKICVKLSDEIVIQSAHNYVANRRAKIEFNVYAVVGSASSPRHAWVCCLRAYADCLTWSTFDTVKISPANIMQQVDVDNVGMFIKKAKALLPGSH